MSIADAFPSALFRALHLVEAFRVCKMTRIRIIGVRQIGALNFLAGIIRGETRSISAAGPRT